MLPVVVFVGQSVGHSVYNIVYHITIGLIVSAQCSLYVLRVKTNVIKPRKLHRCSDVILVFQVTVLWTVIVKSFYDKPTFAKHITLRNYFYLNTCGSLWCMFNLALWGT